MYRNSQTEIDYDDIDFEIRDLVRYINQIDGIETESSCCGHNEKPCMIWFKVETISDLTNLLFNLFDGDCLWKLEFDVMDVHKDWGDIHILLTSGNIKDYPTVNLMIDNLTYRFREYLYDNKEK